MRLVRWAVLASVAVIVCGAAYSFRNEVAHKLGLSGTANAAEQGSSSPAASAQPQGRRGRANPAGAVPVVTVTVTAKPMPILVEAVGTVQAIASIQIKPRLDSQIMKVLVEEGALVKEGDMLFELDQRSLKAQLAQIEAQIRKDQAQVAQTKRDSSRSEDLLGKGAATVVARDTNMTLQKAAEAQLESDEAMRTNILTQLSFTEIKAPVSGRIGSIPNKAGTIKSTLWTGGVDIRYQPQPNLTGVLSLNPDFSQVESAITDINFNYNKKFLADNRPFFQEGSAYFGKNTSYFYSNDVPNFDYGAKLFTRTTGYQLGALVTRAPEARTDYAVNVQREIDSTHKIGGIVVGTDQSAYRNTLAAINAEGRETSGLIYGFDGALTRTAGAPGDGSYVQGTLGWQRDFWTAYLFGSQYTTNFFPADGLLDADLPDTRGVTGYLSYSRDFGVGPIREMTGSATWKVRDTGDGDLQRNYAYVGGTIEFRNEIRLGLFWTGGQYRPVGSVPGAWSTTINHDHYLTASADFNTRSSRLGYGVSCSSGSAGGGPYDYCNLYGWTRPTATTFVNVSLERANSFGRTEQYVVSAGWDITPRHGLYTRYIWNDGSQLRVAYTFHVSERMDFFAVLNTQPGLPTQLSAKLVVTLP